MMQDMRSIMTLLTMQPYHFTGKPYNLQLLGRIKPADAHDTTKKTASALDYRACFSYTSIELSSSSALKERASSELGGYGQLHQVQQRGCDVGKARWQITLEVDVPAICRCKSLHSKIISR